MENSQSHNQSTTTSDMDTKFKCEKCNSNLEYTIFNSSSGVKINSSCDKKHFNTSLLDEYVRDNLSKCSNEKKCKKCEAKIKIKICQFCNNYFCEKCNFNHLTVEHILQNIDKIYADNKFDNLEKDDKFKKVKENLAKAIKYLKNIEEYYKQIENNFKKFMIENTNEIILINLLLKKYLNNNTKFKLLENLDFLLQLNALKFNIIDSIDFNKFLLNNNNYIL